MDQMQLIKDLGIEGLDEKHQQQLLASFADLVQLRMTEKLNAYLDDAALTELDDLAEQQKGDEALASLEQYVPNYQTILAETIEETKVELKQDAQAVLQRVNRPTS